MSSAVQVDNATFEAQVLQSTTPVLVDFWAPWCGPCKMISPIVEELAGEFAGQIKVAKVNVDNNQDLAARYGIRGIPTVMIFKNGESVASLVGLRSKEDLTRAINAAL
jgi:thioredoxin 1